MEEVVSVGHRVIGWLPFKISDATTLVAAFAGAWAAYWLQSKKTDREERRKQVAAAQWSLFCLFQKHNALRNYKNQFIDPFRNQREKSIAIQPNINEIYNKIYDFDFKSISFLIEQKYNKELAHLSILQERFSSVFSLIEYRSKIHLNEIQPKMESAGFIEGKTYLKDEIQSMTGNVNFQIIERITVDMIQSVDKTLEDSIHVKNMIRAIYQKIFPEIKFIDFE